MGIACWVVDPMVHGEVGQIVVRTSKLALRDLVVRRNRRRSGGMIATLAAMCLFASSTTRTSLAYADESPVPTQSAETPALPAEALAPPLPANPAFDLRAQAPEQPSIFQRWWFWTAVGAAAAATVVIIVVSSRGHAPPATDLGNQEFQP
jgi:hypothetical protein